MVSLGIRVYIMGMITHAVSTTYADEAMPVSIAASPAPLLYHGVNHSKRDEDTKIPRKRRSDEGWEWNYWPPPQVGGGQLEPSSPLAAPRWVEKRQSGGGEPGGGGADPEAMKVATKQAELQALLQQLYEAEAAVKMETGEVTRTQQVAQEAQQSLEEATNKVRMLSADLQAAQEAAAAAAMRAHTAQLQLSAHDQLMFTARQRVDALSAQMVSVQAELASAQQSFTLTNSTHHLMEQGGVGAGIGPSDPSSLVEEPWKEYQNAPRQEFRSPINYIPPNPYPQYPQPPPNYPYV